MHTIGTKHTRWVAALAAMSALVAAPVVTAGAAQAKDGRVIKQGTCSQDATWKLKASPDNGQVEIDYEVDSNVVGQVWDVTIYANGVTVFSGQRTTVLPSGSFEVRAFAADQEGSDAISATAANVDGSQTCWGALTF